MKQWWLFILLAGKVWQASLAQTVIWQEIFGTGCSTGTLANGFTSSNGTWTVVNTGTNGDKPNEWYVSAEEQISGTNCGTGCGGSNNRTLHVSSTTLGDLGAAYDAGGLCGFLWCTNTNKRVQSPVINLTGYSNITLSFKYIEFGQGTTDNATLWYFDGTTWTQLADLPKTSCCGGACNGSRQGLFTNYSILLPASANNNPNVRIGFRWVNNDDGMGTDPSFAVDDITLTVPGSLPISLERFEALCEEGKIKFHWKTLSEINNDYFIIQASASGEKFYPQYIIPSQGNSQKEQEYVFISSDSLISRFSYYRLCQVDRDGKEDCFTPVYSHCYKEQNDIRLYPNPAYDKLIIEVNSKQRDYSGYEVKLYAETGNLVYQESLYERIKILPLHFLAEGIYLIRIFDKCNQTTVLLEKIIVMKP